MELTNRRFAIFLVSGLSLAVIVGLLVWKVSDAGVNLNGQEAEFAGQPVAAADASSQEQTREESTSEEDMTSSHSDDTENSAGAENTSGAAGNAAVHDPLAPPNANLGGGRGGAAETSYYRPTNAAPAPQMKSEPAPAPAPAPASQQSARTSAPAQTQQPDSAGTSTNPGEAPSTTTTPSSTTVVPKEPLEPQRASEEAPDSARPPQTEPNPNAEPESPDSQLASEAKEKAQEAGNAAAGALGLKQEEDAPAEEAKKEATKQRPEDPFSASTRIQQAPFEAQAAAEGNATPTNVEQSASEPTTAGTTAS